MERGVDVAECPICQTEYSGEGVETCATCGWDLTPYPPTFGTLPPALAQKRQAQLAWAQQHWQQLQGLQTPITSPLVPASDPQPVLQKLDQIEARLLALDTHLITAQAERTTLQNQIAQVISQLESPRHVPSPPPTARAIALHRASKPEVAVFELESFYEIPKLLNALNAGKSVVLNVKAMPPEVAQRSVDFVSGFIHGINGHQEQLESGIFMFMPRRDEPLMLAPAAEGGREP